MADGPGFGELIELGIRRLPRGEATELCSGLEPEGSIDGMNGPIDMYGLERGWMVVEPVPGGDRVLRFFISRADAEGFMNRRMEQFDRLWDGCGCRIDYDSKEPTW